MHHMIKIVCPDTLRDESLNKKLLLHLFSAPHNSWDKALDYPEDGKYMSNIIHYNRTFPNFVHKYYIFFSSRYLIEI